MKRIYLLLIIFIFFISCINMNDPEKQADYIRCYNSFDKNMVDHIPDKLPTNILEYGYANPKYIDEFEYSAYIYLATTNSESDYIKLKSKLLVGIKYSSNSNDCSFLPIETYNNKLAKKHDTLSSKKFYPVPFEAIYKLKDDTVVSKIENCQVAIKDCKSGNYLKRKSIKRNENLPIEWNNGFSKGFTFIENERKIIYWVILW